MTRGNSPTTLSANTGARDMFHYFSPVITSTEDGFEPLLPESNLVSRVLYRVEDLVFLDRKATDRNGVLAGVAELAEDVVRWKQPVREENRLVAVEREATDSYGAPAGISETTRLLSEVNSRRREHSQ
ncbi:hypothetical protein NDU88_001064 [Pleurodeles waltl]|uniref:Uncharacterized protein n=1 Tax=Pleurodeles waltl TaxID=8319 RepID=A0AAV7TIN7_PLEWA|nr:hypothetical protein NDU88_001064 [Pleurodeles waltl]